MDGIRFSFDRSALLRAVVLCWVGHGYGSWELLSLFCPFRVTHIVRVQVSAVVRLRGDRGNVQVPVVMRVPFLARCAMLGGSAAITGSN